MSDARVETTAEDRERWLIRADDAGRLARDYARLEARLPRSGDGASGEGYGWLCELDNQPRAYWSINPTLGVGVWTNDASGALRFARKIDAERFIANAHWTRVRAIEHDRSADAPPPASDASPAEGRGIEELSPQEVDRRLDDLAAENYALRAALERCQQEHDTPDPSPAPMAGGQSSESNDLVMTRGGTAREAPINVRVEDRAEAASTPLLSEPAAPMAGETHDDTTLGGVDIWECLFSAMKGDVPEALTEEACEAIAAMLQVGFVTPLAEALTAAQKRQDEARKALEAERAQWEETYNEIMARLAKAEATSVSLHDGQAILISEKGKAEIEHLRKALASLQGSGA